MNNIVWLSPTWTTVFILAVVTLLVTTFWDNIKKVFTKNNDGEETSVSAWSKFNNFVSNSLAITIARYFLSVAVLSYSIYCLASVNSAACGTSLIILVIILAVIGIPMSIECEFEDGDGQIIFAFLVLFVQFLMAVLLFIYGGATLGFYVIASMGLNLIILPKHKLLNKSKRYRY